MAMVTAESITTSIDRPGANNATPRPLRTRIVFTQCRRRINLSKPPIA